MPRVRFLRDFDYKHNQHHLSAFKKSTPEYPDVAVTTKAAEAAIAAGAAEYTEEELKRQKVAQDNAGSGRGKGKNADRGDD